MTKHDHPQFAATSTPLTNQMALPTPSSLLCPPRKSELQKVMLYQVPPPCESPVVEVVEKPKDKQEETPSGQEEAPSGQQTKQHSFWQRFLHLFGHREDFKYNKNYK